jgi:phage tail sheath gpL-like
MTTAGLAASARVPGIKLAVVLGGAGTSAGAQDKKLLLIGNKITTALTGASPSFSVSAGTQADATPVLVPGADDAALLFGRGSELHRMAKSVFAQYPDALVYAASCAEAGTAASAVLTFATTSTGAFTVRVVVGGKTIDVSVASGDSATVIAAAVADAILDESDLPVTAQNSSGALTITAKHTGTRGNDLTVDAFFVPPTGATPTRITTSSTSSGYATTCTLSGNGTIGSEYTLGSGATDDSMTNVLAAIDATKYDRIVMAPRTATQLGALVTQIDSQAGVASQLRQQAIAASNATLANATTLATGRNASRLQIVWHHATPTPVEEVAAQVAAARLIGDGAAGGVLAGEASDPAANLDGCRLASVQMQRYVADQPTSTELQSALSNGLTPLINSGSNGMAAIARSITSRSLSGGVNNYSVLDTTNVSVPDALADDLQAFLATELAGAKLAEDSADGSVPRASGVTTPKGIRSILYGRLKAREADGWITDVDANLSLLSVTKHSTVVGRVDCEIPCEPTPGLHILGGNVRQLAG